MALCVSDIVYVAAKLVWLTTSRRGPGADELAGQWGLAHPPLPPHNRQAIGFASASSASRSFCQARDDARRPLRS
jgi:hypothetical protein